MYKLILSLCLSFLLQFSYCQVGSIVFSGTYKQVPFEDFVSSIEQSTNTRFYYKSEWVNDLIVDISGTDLNLSEVLIDLFASTSLNFHIDEYNAVFIYSGTKIVIDLPGFYSSENSKLVRDSENTAELTKAEEKYIQSKKVVDLELINVGSRQNTVKDKASIISGRIDDEATGEPLIGATVHIKELEIGAATDINGVFNLAVKPGKYLVATNYLGMKEKRFYLQVYSAGSITISMEKEMISINEVMITANRNNNVKGMQMGYERVSSRSIKEIPAVMGEKDILKIAQLLPGVLSAGEGASGLNVRGGTADQNLFYINKLPVYNTAHLFGFFTAFNPDIVNDYTLYKSNVPAKYGGRASSVFDITTRQGNKKEFYGKGGISPITAHTMLEGPIVKEKSSFVLSYRGSYSDWLLSRLKDINLKESKASFYDLAGSINTELNDKNILKLFAYKSFDQFSLASTHDYNYSNGGGSISWTHVYSSSLRSDATAVFSEYGFGHNNKSNPSEAYRHEYHLNHTEFKTDFVLLTGSNHRILFGGSGILYNLFRGDILPYGEESVRKPIFLGSEKAIESAVYISDEFSITPRLTALIGLRYSLYSFLGPSKVYEYFSDDREIENIRDSIFFSNNEIVKFFHGPEPRLAFNYKLGINNSIKVSYNRTRQYIFMLSNTFAISPTDQWKLADYHLKPIVTDQVSLGYYHDFPGKSIVTSLEVYKKWSQHAVEYEDGADFISGKPAEQDLLQGDLDSYGIETILKKNSGKLTGWIAYTYSRSFMQVANSIEIGEQINGGKKYPSNFDRPHSISLVSNLRQDRRLSFSGTVVYSTGRPTSYPIAVYQAGKEMVYLYSGRNKYRIPDYFRVDFSINVEGNLISKKLAHSYWMLSVYNLTGRKNAYSIYFERNEQGIMQGYKLSVYGQPIVTLSWNYKFGNYVSE